MNKNLKDFSDSELYQLCQKHGQMARKWSREFGFLLPEVLRRGLHRRRKCQGIHHFASTIGGMSRNVVDRILSLYFKLEDKPLLWNEFRNAGWAKLQVIANVATVETQKFWLDKLKYPKKVLIEYVKEWKNKNLVAKKTEETPTLSLGEPKNAGALEFGDEVFNENSGNLDETAEEKAEKIEDFESTVVEEPKKIYKKLKFKIDKETEFKLRKLQQEQKETVTLGETLKILLDKVEKLEEEVRKQKGRKNESNEPYGLKIISLTTFINKKTSRSISAQKQRQLDKKHNGKCAIFGCNEPACDNHHIDRYVEHGSHSRIIPVCEKHHQMMHLGLIDEEAVWRGGAEVVRIDEEIDGRDKRTQAIDKKVTAYLSG